VACSIRKARLRPGRRQYEMGTSFIFFNVFFFLGCLKSEHFTNSDNWGGHRGLFLVRTGVCCFALLNQYLGLGIVYGLGVSSKAGQGVRTHEMDHQRTTSPCPLLGNLGWPDPHPARLHLNYVPGYTNPLLFLFERT